AALKASDVMSYDVNSMAGEDSESVQGMYAISENFPSSSTDISATPILVIKYEDQAGLVAAEALIDALNADASTYVTADGTLKLDPTLVASTGAFVMVSASSDGTTAGVVLVGVIYNSTDDIGITVSDDTPNLRDYIKGVIGTDSSYSVVSAYLTGTPAINYDTMTGAMSDIQKIDPFTILLILVLVGLFFRSFVSSATPPITIGVAFGVVLALIYGLGTYFDIFFITEIMLLVSMMGAGCDYCIFIIARYREELRNGKPHEEALHEAVKWAGESITVSGASVIIGFGAMSICSFSLVSTMGICLALGIIVALLAALTLIPSILAVVGDRIFWPSKMDSFKEGGKSTKGWYAWCGRVGQRYFEKSSRFSLKHAKAITVVAVIVTLPAAYIALSSETSYDMIGAMQNGDSGEGMDLIGEYADEGMLMPNYVVLEYSQDLATVTYSDTYGTYILTWSDGWSDIYSDLGELAESIVEKDGGESGNIGEITLPFMWTESLTEAAVATGSTDPTTLLTWITANSTTEVAQILAIAVPAIEQQMIQSFMAQGMTQEQATAAALQFLASPYASGIMDYYVNSSCGLIGGSFANSDTGGTVTYLKISIPTNDAAMAPRSMESINAISAAVDSYVSANSDLVTASWITGTAAVMYEVSEVISGEFTNIEILVVVLIIILLFFVMKSYTIPFRSVLTILMSICWTLALTHLVFVNLLGGEVLWLVPLILLVICLGLGMDYDILLTTRIKENVRAKGMSNDEAIHQAVLHTGSVITICGLIMGGAFGTLMLSSMEMLQEFGFALCFAILVDALVVRTYIVPAVMHLLGDWNWKGPRFLQGKSRDQGSE
ncbi:MAG: MMPL family transporter, partial [Thermoplasmata archaeon]|nr:MMPL family transporter [Thermoplasmata archaeon]